MRVRRSSDNTEQDIGYTLAGNLNTAALATFCGSNSCFVRTWYDQSGNGRNLVQTTNSAQPRIVNAGTIYTLNTKPSLEFSGSQFLATAATGETRTNMNSGHYFVAAFSSSLPASYHEVATIAATADSGFLSDIGVDNGRIIHNNRGTPNLETSTSYGSTNYLDNTLSSWASSAQSGAISLRRNGTLLTNPTTSAQTIQTGNGTVVYVLGCRRLYVIAGMMIGGVSEWVYTFNSRYSDSDVSTLQTNQRSFFAIP